VLEDLLYKNAVRKLYSQANDGNKSKSNICRCVHDYFEGKITKNIIQIVKVSTKISQNSYNSENHQK